MYKRVQSLHRQSPSAASGMTPAPRAPCPPRQGAAFGRSGPTVLEKFMGPKPEPPICPKQWTLYCIYAFGYWATTGTLEIQECKDI